MSPHPQPIAGRIRVRPNPAPAGGTVEVEYDAKPLFYRTPGGDWVEVPLDDKGRARVRVPPGQVLIFFNRSDPPATLEVEIVEPRP